MTPRNAVHDPVSAFIARLLCVATLRGDLVALMFGRS